jgi:hypothetical protein
MSMIDYIRYRRKIAGLFRQRKSMGDAYAREIHNAREEGRPREEIESIEADAHSERHIIDEDISILVTDYLLMNANRRFVPIPSHDEDGMWKQCDAVSNRYVLTNAGISKLLASLRSEKKERNEIVLKTLAAITGIIGAATGFLAVWLKK